MKLVFRAHALQRMFERGISVDDVEEALRTGAIIEDYPDDFPLPSRLVLGFVSGRALHIVGGDNMESSETIIITVYEPNPAEWDDDFVKRKP